MLETDITTDLSILQSHLDGMLDRVQHNSLTFKRLQAFEMRLLSLNSLAEIIEFILMEAKDLFELDVLSLCLYDPTGEIATYLASDHYDYSEREGFALFKHEQLFKRHFAFSDQPLLGRFQTEHHGEFFARLPQMPSSMILAPLIRRGKHLGALNLGSHRSDRFLRNMATDFVEHLASVVAICLENSLNFETLRHTSLLDPLTGVNNRRFLEQRIVEELDRSLRSRRPLSCLFLDIDFFKQINDTFGHQAGDHMLSMVAATVKKQLRNNDVLSRYGGEEFVALLSESDDSAAGAIAERIRIAIADLSIDFSGQRISATISIGSATFDPGKSIAQQSVSGTAENLIQAADAALYDAKHEGRNRVKNRGVI
ncbi:MAG: GGDEF domain-containing protein [Gammaproteobacteria bacterium]